MIMRGCRNAVSYFIQNFTEAFGILSLQAILYKIVTSNANFSFKVFGLISVSLDA